MLGNWIGASCLPILPKHDRETIVAVDSARVCHRVVVCGLGRTAADVFEVGYRKGGV